MRDVASGTRPATNQHVGVAQLVLCAGVTKTDTRGHNGCRAVCTSRWLHFGLQPASPGSANFPGWLVALRLSAVFCGLIDLWSGVPGAGCPVQAWVPTLWRCMTTTGWCSQAHTSTSPCSASLDTRMWSQQWRQGRESSRTASCQVGG
jgi:hypothetical protein